MKSIHVDINSLKEACDTKVVELKAITSKRKGGFLEFWSKGHKKSKADRAGEIPTPECDKVVAPTVTDSVAETTNAATNMFKEIVAPQQKKLKDQIHVQNELLVSLYKKRSLNQLSENDLKELKEREGTLAEAKKRLKKCEQDQVRQKRARNEKKKKLSSLDENTRMFLTGKKNFTPGRPTNNDDNLLIDAITRLAMYGSAAHEKRRSELIRTVKTLDQLTAALHIEGFNLQRSSVYLRLIPRNQITREGKRHVKTAPVRLVRAQNSEHKEHPSTRFAKATIRYLEELAGLLGPEEVSFLSQDDKCKVPIGLTAANKQAPLLMHLDYLITLPDHDYVIASQHKLIPSVIGAMEVKKNCLGPDAVTYSGPTNISIRSAKHLGSNAYHHLEDLKTIRTLEEFKPFLFSDGNSKSILIITVDGGPDENPRYEKTI